MLLIIFFSLAIGYLSKTAHQGGKILLSITAKNNLDSRQNSLSLKYKLNLYAHAQRLHVRKKYGVNYGSELLFLKCKNYIFKIKFLFFLNFQI